MPDEVTLGCQGPFEGDLFIRGAGLLPIGSPADFNATSKILEERGVDAAWMDDLGNLLPVGGPGGSTGFIFNRT